MANTAWTTDKCLPCSTGSAAAALPSGEFCQGLGATDSSGIRAGAVGSMTPRHTRERSEFIITPTEYITTDVSNNAEEPSAAEQRGLISEERKSDSVTSNPVRGRQVRNVMSDVVQPPASEQRTLNPEVRSEPGTKSTQSNSVVGHHVPHVNVANFKSNVTINAYSGAFSESLTNFVRQFKDHTMAVDAGASEETKRYSFLTFLTGNARDRAEDFMAVNPEAKVDEIIGDLKATFENELTGQLREKQFSKCRQGRGEPIEAYYNRVRALASQAFRAEDRATIEKKTRDAFLDGLEDSIRYNVKDKNPKTCRAAFDEALRQEILRDDRAAALQYPQSAAIFEEIRVLNEKWDNQNTQRRKGPQRTQHRPEGTDNQWKPKFLEEAERCPSNSKPAAVQNHQQPNPSHVNAATGHEDVQSQLEIYRKQVAELQRLNTELLAEPGRGRTTSCLSWPATQGGSPPAATTDRVNSARLSSPPLTTQIPVRINGFPVFALIDTGSTITVAGRAFATRIGIPSLYQASATHAVGLGGNEVRMAGAAFANICVGSRSLVHRIHFTTGECTPHGARDYHIILGNDFLSQLPRFYIDYQAETFHVGEDVVPIGNQHRAHTPKVLDIRVSEDTMVPAQSEKILACHKLWSTDEGDRLYLVTSQLLTEKSLLTAPVLINLKNIKILVTNPSDCDVFLKKDTKAAEAVEVFEDDNKISLDNAVCTEAQKQVLRNLFSEFHDVFSKNAYDLGSSKTDPVHIYTSTEIPVRGRPYRVPVKYQAELQKHINGLLLSERITESNTPWISPIVLVPKKNGSLRVCLDFRKLNEVTVPDNFPLPRIDSIVEKVGGSKYFSSLDMANGYLQLRLDEESSYKCGFTTEDKVYAYTHLPFGLKSAASYFQRALRTVLAGLEKDVLVYIDDVLIFSKTFECHVATLKKVLTRFRAYNLKASPAKCEFVKKSITFLGHEINEASYSPNEANLNTIKQLAIPKDAKGVLRFLGMAGFFRKFISNFSNIAEPLTRLNKKDVPFEWTSQQQEAFDTLKNLLA
uniref:RNA-directed DNA polymerase n=1 Tax=Caenorhabditis japonica TaxID=281687 RepID=A0A8R1I4V9_CAEJA